MLKTNMLIPDTSSQNADKLPGCVNKYRLPSLPHAQDIVKAMGNQLETREGVLNGLMLIRTKTAAVLTHEMWMGV